MNNTVQIT